MNFRLPAWFEYGNYGGVNHSGEGIDPKTGETKSFVLPPADGLDAIFRAHDEAYRDAAKESDWKKAEEMYYAADKALVDALKKYDPYKDPMFTDDASREAAANFAWKAGNLFQGIINQTEKMYPGIGTKRMDQIILENVLRSLGMAVGDIFDLIGPGNAYACRL